MLSKWFSIGPVGGLSVPSKFDVLTAVEVPMRAQVHSSCLGISFLVFKIVYGVAFLCECLYFGKGYLAPVKVSTWARLQLQHPVQACNPLHNDCLTNYARINNLTYCSGLSGSSDVCGAQDAPNCPCMSARCPCKYLDEFDLLPGHTSNGDEEQLFVPTRLTTLAQEIKCANGCPKRYQVISRSTAFVADIDSFTVLVAHSYAADFLNVTGASDTGAGFIRFCFEDAMPPWQTTWKRLTSMSRSTEVCLRKHIPGTGSNSPELDGMLRLYDDSHLWPQRWQAKWNELAPVYNIKPGNVLRVGRLLEFLEIDLDAPIDSGEDPSPNSTSSLRINGLTLKVEVRYLNYLKASLPNSFEPVYEIGFRHQRDRTANEFKIMTSERKGETEREVLDQHGIEFSVRRSSDIRYWSGQAVFYEILQWFCAFYVVKYAVILVGLQCWRDDDASKFRKRVFPNIHRSTDDRLYTPASDDDCAVNETLVEEENSARLMGSQPTTRSRKWWPPCR